MKLISHRLSSCDVCRLLGGHDVEEVQRAIREGFLPTLMGIPVVIDESMPDGAWRLEGDGVSVEQRHNDTLPAPAGGEQMANKFQEGQQLKVVRGSEYGSRLLKDAIVTVSHYDNGYVHLKEAAGGGWLENRFEAIEPAKPEPTYPKAPVETYVVLEKDGTSYHTSDLNEIEDGEKVAVYYLVRTGTLVQGKPSIR